MEFALSEDQRMLQDSISGFLKDNASLDTIRKIAEGDAEAKAGLDTGLAEMGILGLHVPETMGGSGLGLLEACLVQEALGYTVALGLPELRQGIAALYRRWYGVDLDPARVVVTPGSSGAF